jgi:L-aspartate oxidase
MSVRTDDVIVVGSGVAGLVCALSMAPRSVTLMTKTPQLEGGSSLWAQGGIAASIGPEDSPEAHAADTLSAGVGLSDPERTRALTEMGAASLEWLCDIGVPFDRNIDGTLALAKEAAHRHSRVVHAGGDRTGHALVRSLSNRLRETTKIDVLEDTVIVDLVVRDGEVKGVIAFSQVTGWAFHQASSVVFATGGIGMAWWQTTNPVEATGDGLAMAARAGAKLTNLEFVQFHPTALAVESDNGASLPLLTEALRGAGALLLDESGCRFMVSEHREAELAPRDVVARAIQKRARAGQRVFLDLRPALSGSDSFPQAIQTAKDAGFNPFEEPLPVTPASHYHMGGIDVDLVGRTSINGLWACGEVASTGIHGANRLASNSLLEAVVYARQVAEDIRVRRRDEREDVIPAPAVPQIPPNSAITDLKRIVSATRKAMSQYVGISRSGSILATGIVELSRLDRTLHELIGTASKTVAHSAEMVRQWGEARNLILVAQLVSYAAHQREESRGAHYRDDYPTPRAEWRRAQSFAADALVEWNRSG